MAIETITSTTLPFTTTSNPRPSSNTPSSKFAPPKEDVGFTAPQENQFKDPYAEREYIKGRLAAAYRIFGHYGLNEGAAGHITVQDPVEPDTFWVRLLSDSRISTVKLISMAPRSNLSASTSI
jgi:hypothetical protein